MEPGDRKGLVVALPAFLPLAPARLETIYTAREEALVDYQGAPHPGPATNSVFSNSRSGGATTRTHTRGGMRAVESFSFEIRISLQPGGM